MKFVCSREVAVEVGSRYPLTLFSIQNSLDLTLSFYIR